MPTTLDQFLDLLQGLPPELQAVALFIGTFILEDLAAIAGGLLLAAGSLDWNAAFWACFLGIWLGDVGLYALARTGGRSWFERSRFQKFAPRVKASEAWFAQKGDLILIFSRLLPGARLPTYLAAGFLRVKLSRFLWITGSASFIWTLIVLLATKAAGVQLAGWLREYRHGAWWLVAGLLGVMALVHLLPRVNWRTHPGTAPAKPPLEVDWTAPAWRRAIRSGLMEPGVAKRTTRSCRQDAGSTLGAVPGCALNWMAVQEKMAVIWAQWTQWEFWPGWLFYPPVGIWCLWLAVKYRGLALPTVANPGIFAGGMVGESKMATLKDLSRSSTAYTAEAELIRGETTWERLASLRHIVQRMDLSYPVILKPDMGQRGAGVKLIREEAQAVDYFKETNAPLLVQRYAPGPMEAGIFYVRQPHEAKGHIFAITKKIFPVVTGDGLTTVAGLIRKDARAKLIADKYLTRLGVRQHEVLATGETLRLVEAGNHAQGCIFQDGSHLRSPELEARIDEISQKLNGFYIGRYDIRYASDEELQAGRNFQIIELNGAAAEATSIYDARNSLWSAYRTLFQQWELVFAIGAANRKAGQRTMPLLEVWRNWRRFLKLAETYPLAD